LKESLAQFQDIELTHVELKWLEKRGFFSDRYLEYLSRYRFDPGQVEIGQDSNEQLDLKIRGAWKDAILWEVPLLAWISELYYREVDQDWGMGINSYYQYTYDKATELIEMGAKFADFGTRRRRSYEIHDVVIRALKTASTGMQGAGSGQFAGTSNLHFSRVHGVGSSGTMAHEWIMAHEALYGLGDVHQRALQNWLEVHEGRFAIALTDTFTVNLFFNQFTSELGKRYTGLRHDSGDPLEFADRTITFYGEKGIDPKSKTIIFSDGIDPDAARKILDYVGGRINVGFGIGTNLTNDFPQGSNSGIVIKLTEINGKRVAKTTSNPSKATGDPDKIRKLLQEISRIEYEMEAVYEKK